VSLDDLPVGANTMRPCDARLYVAREDVAEARRLIEPARL
jgi:hypothetical protein